MKALRNLAAAVLPYASFVLRRLVLTLPLLLGVALIAFLIMDLAPGDYLDSRRHDPQVSKETIQRLEEQYGLNKPWYEQYFHYVRGAVTGNFGFSFDTKQPVFALIGTYVGNTLLLTLSALAISWLVAIPMGIYAAVHKNGLVDRFTAVLAYSGISAPSFFVALLALLLAQKTGWFPVGGMTSADHDKLPAAAQVMDVLHHLILPALVLGTRGVASLMRQMRGNLLDVLGENYVLAARARGLSERLVILKHAVRNAINPLITIFGFEIAGLLGGAVFVENVMQWPGLGRLLLFAVQGQDLYVAMAAFTMGACMLIVGNLISDLLLAVTDPRIRIS